MILLGTNMQFKSKVEVLNGLHGKENDQMAKTEYTTFKAHA